MKIYECLEQGTDEWLKVRLGKFTASKASAIGNNGKGLTTLVWNKIEEIISGEIPETYKNTNMKRGNTLEPEARISYEIKNGVAVRQIGFVELDKYTGCSPDGLIAENGLIEIKCPTNRVFYEYMQDGIVKKDYIWQMQMQMMITDRQWCDYVVYNPNFKNSLITKKVERDEKVIKQINVGILSGISQIQAILEKMNIEEIL